MIIEIEKLVHGGAGMGSFNGKKVFVPYTAAGDLVEVEVVATHTGYDEARVVKIITPSKDRVEPRCPVFGRCGGCQWQYLSYDAQLKWKKEIIKDALERAALLDRSLVKDAIPSPKEWNYRNRIQLHVDREGRVGFYAPNSNDVVEFDRCFIADERINDELKLKRDELRKRERGISICAYSGCATNPSPLVGDGGGEGVRLREGSFGQVNTLQNENLKRVVKDAAIGLLKDVKSVILELYAGSGNLTFELIDLGRKVIASDVDRKAVECGKNRASSLKISNLTFIDKDAKKTLRLIDDEVGLLLIDPPRKGIDDVLEDVVKLKPASIIYVSCEPSTLARDLKYLSQNGYDVLSSQPIDMFPQTFHIESVTTLIRR